MRVLAAWVPAFALALTAAAAGPPGTATLATRGAVLELAADGGRVALVVARPRDCARVVVWTPPRATVTLQGAQRCDVSPREGTHGVALAGSRAAWVRTGGGNTLETTLMTATLAAPRPLVVGFGVAGPGQSGSVAGDPVGDADLLVFAAYRRCEEAVEGGSPSTLECPARRRRRSRSGERRRACATSTDASPLTPAAAASASSASTAAVTSPSHRDAMRRSSPPASSMPRGARVTFVPTAVLLARLG